MAKYTCVGTLAFHDTARGSSVEPLDDSFDDEKSAVGYAVECTDDWDRVTVFCDGIEIGHAAVPQDREYGGQWYPLS